MASREEDYTQILIHPEHQRAKRWRISDPGQSSEDSDAPSIKWLTLTSLILTGIVAIMATVAVIRYEGKVGDYETRITELERDLDTFFTVLAQELDHDHSRGGRGHHGVRKTGDIVTDEGWRELVGDLEGKLHPQTQSKEDEGDPATPLPRRKRQILPAGAIPRFPNLPNSFGPEVERTSDGVPIVDQSYRIHGSVPDRRYLPIVTPPPAPTPDSTGLRLYEGLVETGGVNEPKSPDFFPNPTQSPLLPHHKVSAAWSERTGSGLQLRSGDAGFASEFGPRPHSYQDMGRYGGPTFGVDNAYTRSYPGRDDRLRSLDNGRRRPTAAPTFPPSRAGTGVGVGATYHRNSRVAATYSAGIDNYRGGAVTQAPRRRSRVQGQGQRSSQRFDEYPPLRRMGSGQGEVIARVIQDNDQNSGSSTRWVGDRRKTGSLAGEREHRREAQYLRRRPVETYRRPLTPVTEHPAGYSERAGPLNVTIGRSVPFGTYYSSDRGNWEVNTQPPSPPTRYRSRY